jgi:hypothetical protein
MTVDEFREQANVRLRIAEEQFVHYTARLQAAVRRDCKCTGLSAADPIWLCDACKTVKLNKAKLCELIAHFT